MVYDVTQDVDSVALYIYTVSFRLVRVILVSGSDTAGLRMKQVSASALRDFGSGSYYYYIEAVSKSGVKARSKIQAFIILK